MRNRLATLLLLLLAAAAAGQEIAPPQGLVNDRAGVIDAPTRAKLTALLTELQQKTGAEIAVLTVDTTAPLDDYYGSLCRWLAETHDVEPFAYDWRQPLADSATRLPSRLRLLCHNLELRIVIDRWRGV